MAWFGSDPVCAVPSEGASRHELLATGRNSDLQLTVTVPCPIPGPATGRVLGQYAVHCVLLAMRCRYFWTAFSPTWAPPPEDRQQQITVCLPMALDATDGAWETGDIRGLLEWVYRDGADDWSRAWRQHVEGVKPGMLTVQTMRRWLRLHRLAQYFCFDALAQAVEQFVGGHCLDVLARWVAQEHGVLGTQVRALVHTIVQACAAVPEERRGLSERLHLWIPTVLASVANCPREVQAEWPTASGWALHPGAVTTRVCPNCFVQASPGLSVEHAPAASWTLLRPTHIPVLTALVGPLAMALRPAPVVAFETLDGLHGRRRSRIHVADTDKGGMPPMYPVPAESHASGRLYVGRCDTCARVDPVHVVIIEPLHTLETRASA